MDAGGSGLGGTSKGVRSLGLLSWIIVGLIAGWLAGELIRGSGLGMIGDLVIGMIGAVTGGFLASALFALPESLTSISVNSIIVAFLGSLGLIVLFRILRAARIS
jgi:uncharacterized membrane protein YeaQ/YmgE (transglycosylase-associated protein family)